MDETALRILLIEDSDPKAETVLTGVGERLANTRVRFSRAKDYEGALTALSEETYDIVIMDLKIPGAKMEPSTHFSRALLARMVEGSANSVAHVIGLTEFPEAAAEERAFFERNMFALDTFNWREFGWAERLVQKIEYLIRARERSLSFMRQSHDFDLVIMVARYGNEFAPILQRMQWEGPVRDKHPLFGGLSMHLGWLKGVLAKPLKTAFICVGEMGMAASAAISTRAIMVFRPRLLAMLGMCCGFRNDECASKSKLCDIIIAREAACWDEGKYQGDDERQAFANRAWTITMDAGIINHAKRFWEKRSTVLERPLKEYCERRIYQNAMTKYGREEINERPEVKFGRVVSGNSIIADTDVVRAIIDRHPQSLGLEMEIFGVYKAASLLEGQRPLFCAIKGVADFGDGNKRGCHYDDAQVLASQLSFIVFAHMVKEANVL